MSPCTAASARVPRAPATCSAGAIRDTVAKAFSIAGFTAEDESAGLPEPDTLARDFPDLDLFHPWSIDPDTARDMAIACEATALDADPRIGNSEGATLSTHRGLRVFGNSLGFLGSTATTLHSLSCVVVAESGDEMQRDYWYSTVRDWRDLEDGASIGKQAAARALRRLNARKLSTVTAPVLFVPELARGLFGHFLGAIRGGSQYRRASFLLDAAGEQIFPTWMQISERPHLRKALSSAAFDSEGVVTRDREIIASGVLTGYVLSTYSARKLGLKTTGNAGGVHNLIVGGGTEDFAGLLRRMDRGLVVTELMGQGVNGVTGDYSRGAAGLLGRERRDCLPRARDHDRREPQADVSADRRRRQRRRYARRHSHGIGAARRDDDRGGMKMSG